MRKAVVVMDLVVVEMLSVVMIKTVVMDLVVVEMLSVVMIETVVAVAMPAASRIAQMQLSLRIQLQT